MRKAVISAAVLLIAVMISALRLRCSITSMQLCGKARHTVGTPMQPQQQLHLSNPAGLRIPHRPIPAQFNGRSSSKMSLLLSGPIRTTSAAAGSSEGSSSSSNKPKGSLLSVLQTAKRFVTTTARTLIAALLLVAAAPYVLSSTWGTSAACSIASRVLPGDVHVQRIHLGWSQPLALEGLTLHEGAAGSSRQLLSVERMSTAGGTALQEVGDCKYAGLVMSGADARCCENRGVVYQYV